MKKVRLGILGMGNMGSGHLENILNDRCPEVEVTAVCDLNPARLEFRMFSRWPEPMLPMPRIPSLTFFMMVVSFLVCGV